MNELAVHWHQGMFLRPHHFQAADRYWHDQLQQSSRWDVHYNWGVRKIQINLDALKNFSFEVLRLEARLKDGTMVRVVNRGELPALELRDAFVGGRNGLQVALAVPRAELGRKNLGNGRADGAYRYYSEPPASVADENTGQELKPVQFRRMNGRLILHDDAGSAGYDVLPLARIERSAQAEAAPELDKFYIPPLLACDGWDVLQVEHLQKVSHIVNKSMKLLAQQMRTRRISFDSQSAEDRKIIEKLRVRNEIAPHLRIMAFAEGIHPLTAYLELCRALGKLSIFTPEYQPPDDLPPYDHDDLGTCFGAVTKYLVAALRDEEIGGYEEVPFVGSELKMKVEMNPKWFAPGYEIYVGVHCPLPPEQVTRHLRGGLNMKIGSFENVDEIFRRGLRGLAFNYKPHPPRVLPQNDGLIYFQIEPKDSPEEWEAVRHRYNLAIRFNHQLIAGNIEGKDEVVIQVGVTAVKMRFILYVLAASGNEPTPTPR